MKQLFQTKSRFILLLLVLCCFSLSASAECPRKKKTKGKEQEQTEYKGDVGTTITLVTSGTGETREEATKNALRNALEQTYGTFVSSNSKVVNDELISDEIVSISTGNIVKYEILSINGLNSVEVTTKVVVSISNLQSYAKNKGMSAELAGNTFAMNLKMEELNKKNQDLALKHLLEQTQIMAKNLFDYGISVGNPEKTPKGVQVPVIIRIFANDNTLAYYDYFHKTLSSIAVQKITGDILDPYEQGVEIDGMNKGRYDSDRIVYKLRSEYNDPEPRNTIKKIFSTLGGAVLNCEVIDNIGNVSGFEKNSNYDNVTDNDVAKDYVCTNKLKCYRNTGLMGYRVRYKPSKYGWSDFTSSIWYLPSVSGVYFWMNAVKPHKGEKLYDIKLFLMYSIEEIGKISKIEIRPKSR